MGDAQVGGEDPRAHARALVEGAEVCSEPCGLGQSPAGYRTQTDPQRTLGADSGCLQML